jgi:integrase/recombinase XerD
MTLQHLYRQPKAIIRHKQPPLGDYQDGFQDWMHAKKFAVSTMIVHVTYVTLFNQYLVKRHIKNLDQVQQKHIDNFVRQLDANSRPRYRPWLWAIHRFEEYLLDRGLRNTDTLNVSANDVVLKKYLQWLEISRNLCPATIELRRQYLTRFFNFSRKPSIVNQLATLTPAKLQTLFVGYVATAGLSARRSMQATLRTFLTFCYLEKLTSQDLSPAIPTLHTYRLSQLPRAITDQDIKMVFALIDRSTPAGMRDYAIIQLLYHYGVRGGQIRALRMTDIDWRKGIIRFPALKWGKSVVMPLVDEVGAALLDYLQYGRPHEHYAEVFLTCRAPFHPFLRSSTLTALLARYLRQVRHKPPYGTHCYRHGFATRAFNQGQSLKTIADCLGHRSIQSTMIYTKVDSRNLKTVTLEIPGGVQ